MKIKQVHKNMKNNRFIVNHFKESYNNIYHT